MTREAGNSPTSTAPPSAAAARATHLRLVRAPDTEPPEAAPSVIPPGPTRRASVAGAPTTNTDAPFQGTLALLFTLPSGVPVEPAPRRHLRLTTYRPPHAYRSDAFRTDDDEWEREPPVPTPRADLPDPRRWTARLVQAGVEVRIGDRPAAQLLRWTSREVYDHLIREIRPRAGRSTPQLVRRSRPVIKSLHLSEPADGVVEACAVVHDGRRAGAVALRLEGLDGRWLCTAFNVV